jgi:hypothetical protein
VNLLFPEMAREPVRFVMLQKIALRFDNLNAFLYWCRANLWWSENVRVSDQDIFDAVREHCPGAATAWSNERMWAELRRVKP